MLSILLMVACGGGGGGSSFAVTDNYRVSLSYPTASADLGGVSQTLISGKLARSDSAPVSADDINFVSVNGVFATLDADDPSRWSVQIPVTVNTTTNLDITVGYSDGSTDTLSHSLKNSLQFSQASNIVLDKDNNRFLVSGIFAAQPVLGAVDLDTGENSIISSADVGVTLEAGADLSSPIALAIDNVNNRALVIQFGSSVILAIDLTTGDRSFFSTAGDFANPVSLIVDTENERALVIDNGLNAIIAIDFIDGARHIVSGSIGSGLLLGDGPGFVAPKSIAFIESGFVLVMDSANDGVLLPIERTALVNPLFVVNLETGERRVLSDNSAFGSGPDFDGPLAVGLDSSNPSVDRVVIFNNGNDSLYAVDLLGNRTIVSGPGSDFPGFVFGFAIDSEQQRVLLPNIMSSGGLIAINLNTGIRTAFAKTSTGSGATFDNPQKIVLDSANNRVLIVEDDGIVAVDLVTGNRSIFSKAGIGSGPGFSSPTDIELDSANNRALVVDGSALIALELTTGNRTIFSDATGLATGITLDSANDRLLMVRNGALLAVGLDSADQAIISDSATGSGPDISPGGITLDSANNRVLIVNFFPGFGLGGPPEPGLLAIDLATGDRTALLGGDFISSGLSDPQGLAMDSTNNRVLIVDDVSGNPALMSVDINNGNLSVLSDTVMGAGPVLVNPKGIVIDNENNRAMIVDSVLNALLVVDLTTGDRAITSQ
ncbi:MAG: hypothetical protein L3J98_00860 [Gammaproteobacteria bacterium]|nr:hypothetical protein [Gammaproteobacteria bacterium]MCF6258705.1 hypothetical protein [Gammaproteobacteria bacterium]